MRQLAGMTWMWIGLVGAAALGGGCRRPADPPYEGYVGSQSCRECHARFYELWAPSHHGKAMQPVTAAFVAEELTPQTEPIRVGASTFMADLPGMQVWEDGPAGRKAYPMLHAMGGKNVYFFLAELERGRLQVLPVSYRIASKEWYNTTASMVRHAIGNDEPLAWTDPMLTFNTACYSCHVSQLSKNYDVETDSYHTEWLEPGINCEACHGPAAEHNRICRAAPKGTVPADLKILLWSSLSPAQVNDACATCHAKARPITPGFMPGENFFDHYDLTTLEDRDFHPDGRDLGENYTHTGWLMNPCAKSGMLDCDHCHTSSGRFRQKDDPNQACMPCHAQRVRNATEHTHHPAGSKGDQCIGCHMPMTSFAHMNRSDHSMRPPTPAASMAFGSDNACSLCHTNRSVEPLAATVREWHPNGRWRDRILMEGQLVKAARAAEWKPLSAMLDYIADPASDEVVVTSLLRLMVDCTDPAKWDGVRGALSNKSPLVRSAAATGLRDDIATPATVRALAAATADPFRLVRIQAAAALALYPLDRLPLDERRQVERASSELMTSFTSRPDDWSSYYNLGNYHGDRGHSEEALQAYRQAIRLRDDVLPPLVNAAIAAARLGNTADGIAYLEKACAMAPTNSAVNFNLGLAYAEIGQLPQAEMHLRTAMQEPGGRAPAAYNLAVLVAARDQAEAIALCGVAAKADPGHPRYAYTQAYYQNAARAFDEAIATLQPLVKAHPDYAEAWVLLGELLVQTDQIDAARQHYHAMRNEKSLPITARTLAQGKLAGLQAGGGQGAGVRNP